MDVVDEGWAIAEDCVAKDAEEVVEVEDVEFVSSGDEGYEGSGFADLSVAEEEEFDEVR